MVVSVTLIKKFTYRSDSEEEWSNTYFLSGSEPADSTAWKALADALIAQEKLCYTSASVVVRAYGYNSDADLRSAVWSYDYAAASASVPGSLATTGGAVAAGDAAAVLEWKTSRLTSPGGKPIYLRKYLHSVPVQTGNTDFITTIAKTALETFGTKMFDGSFLSSRTIRSRATSETILSRKASPYITTRTLKRRGKRP